MPHTNAWDNARPSSTDKVKEGDDELRRLRIDLHDRLSDIFSNWPDGDPLVLTAGIVAETMLASAVQTILDRVATYYSGTNGDAGASIGSLATRVVTIGMPWEAAWPAYLGLSLRFSSALATTERLLGFILEPGTAGSVGVPAVMNLSISNPTAGAITLAPRGYTVLMTVPPVVVV